MMMEVQTFTAGAELLSAFKTWAAAIIAGASPAPFKFSLDLAALTGAGRGLELAILAGGSGREAALAAAKAQLNEALLADAGGTIFGWAMVFAVSLDMPTASTPAIGAETAFIEDSSTLGSLLFDELEPGLSIPLLMAGAPMSAGKSLSPLGTR